MQTSRDSRHRHPRFARKVSAGQALAAGLIVLGAWLGLAAAPAGAARIRPVLSAVTLPLERYRPAEANVVGVAVNQSTHHLFVTTSAGLTPYLRTTWNLDENGVPDETRPLVGTDENGENDVAVDNSGGSYEGYIYTTNFGGFIQQYYPSGEATSLKITDANLPPDGTPQTGGLPPVQNSGSFSPRTLAVGLSGNVFATDGYLIDEFSPTGTFVAQAAIPVAAADIAVDSSGNIFIANANEGGGTGLFKYTSLGTCEPITCAPFVEGRFRAVAVDSATGTIFTSNVTATGTQDGVTVVNEYDAAGHFLGKTELPSHGNASGIGVDESTERLIVGEDEPGPEYMLTIFGGVEVVPDVELEEAEAVTDDSATLKGHVGAAEVAGATCAFQYVGGEEFAAHGFENAAEAPCPGGPFSGTTMEPVEVALHGLRGGTTYHFRLVGRNSNGSNPTDPKTFTTEGPSVTATEAAEASTVGATLKANVDPNGEATDYRFQYVTQAEFEASGYAGAVEVPAGGAPLGEGSAAIPVAQQIQGLTPGTEYRFRVVAEALEFVTATSEWTTKWMTTGPDRTFTTFKPTPQGLPDGRAYEQVSPTQKNGANVQGEKNAVRASLDGERLTFASYAGIPGGDGQQQFASYLASRGAGGWSTQGMLPPASAGSIANILGWDEELNHVYDFASEPVAPTTRLLDRSSADGSVTTLALLERGTSGSVFSYAGASADGGIALVESLSTGLLPGAQPGKQNVYAYSRAAGRLVLAGVMNDLVAPSGGAMAGSYDWFQTGSTSATGGAAENYFTQDQRAISSDGQRVFFTAGGTGQLYVRENPFAPQSAMSGEECTEAAKACTVRISAAEEGVTDPDTPAAFVGASADGSVVYFLDKGKLTADSTAGKGSDLYRYDLDDDSLTDLTVDSADRSGAQVAGVLAVSEDGEDVYFAAAGALAAPATNAPLGEDNVYALRGSRIEFVARLGSGQSEEEAGAVNWAPSSKFAVFGEKIAHASRVSADGQTLLFNSSRQLTPFDNHGVRELYLFHAGGPIQCISCNPTGTRPQGPAGVQLIPVPGFTPARNYAFMTRNLAANGRRVIFDSGDQLVAADKDHANDVYEWEQKGEGSCQSDEQGGGCIFLLSGGVKGASYFGDADTKGRDAFFFTEQQLVAQDRDRLIDAYDARTGGGIASQNATPPAPCEGEGCLGPAGSPAAPAAAGTATNVGPGNPPPPAGCRKGQVHRHGKCVKKHAKKKHKKHKSHKGKHNGKRHKKGAKRVKGGSGK